MITGKDSRYKFFWVGNDRGTGSVGVLLAEKWVEKVYDVSHISDRLIVIKLVINEMIVSVLSVYAPQVGLDEASKDAFYDQLQTTVAKLNASETLLVCGDINGHIGKLANGFEGVHGGHGYGERNTEVNVSSSLL